MNRALIGAVTLSAAVLAGCSSGGDDAAGAAKSAGTSASATPASTAAPSTQAVPDGWRKIESPEVGLSIAVPKRWIEIDVGTGDIVESLRKAGVSGATAEAIERGAAQLEGKNLLYVVDTAGASGGYINNISGICGPNGGVTAEQLELVTKVGLARVGAQDVESSTLTIGGMPAVKVGYTVKATIAARAVQFRVLVPGDRICGLTFGMKPGDDIKELDEIARTFRALP